MTEIAICQRCYLDGPIDLALLTERRNEARKAKEVTAMENEQATTEAERPGDAVSDQADGASSEAQAEPAAEEAKAE